MVTLKLHGTGIVIISISGPKLTEDDNANIKKLITDYLAVGKKSFIFNLEKLGFVRTNDLAAIIAAHTDIVTHAQGRMALARPTDKVKSLLDITKLNSAFPIYDTLEQAITALNTPPNLQK